MGKRRIKAAFFVLSMANSADCTVFFAIDGLINEWQI